MVSLGSANVFLRKPCRFPEQIVLCLDNKEGNIASFVCSKTISRSMLDSAYAQTYVETEKLVGAWNCRQCTYMCMCMCVFLHGGMRITSERVRVCIS